jgi:hypothetical protein
MGQAAPLNVFNAVNATTTSNLIPRNDAGVYEFEITKTNTGTGDIAFQTNSRDDARFERAPTVGWVQHDLAAGTGVTGGKLDVPATDPFTAKVVINTKAKRIRVVFTKAAGTTALTVEEIGGKT